MNNFFVNISIHDQPIDAATQVLGCDHTITQFVVEDLVLGLERM